EARKNFRSGDPPEIPDCPCPELTKRHSTRIDSGFTSMDKIKQELLESYRSHGGINHMDGPNLPSRESVDFLATDLMHLLFPGYFEKRTLTKQEFDEALDERLHHLRDNLTTEIAKCLQCRKAQDVNTDPGE